MEPQPEFVTSVSKYFNNICRLCLKQATLETLQNLQYNISSSVLKFIEGSLIYKLPEKICEQCLSFLTQITSFINKCKHSQNILKQIEGECDLIKPSNELQVDILDDPDSTNELPIDCHSNDSDIEIKDEKLIAPLPDHLDNINEKPFDEREEKLGNDVTASILDHLDYIKKEPEDVSNIPAKQKKRKKKQIPQSQTTKNVLKICAKCGEAVPILRDHYKISRGCLPRNYRCKECILTFTTSYELEIHKRVHHLKETYKCHICSHLFRYKNNLRRHLEAHENPKQFVCEKCGKAYSTKCHLEEHINSHTGVKPFRCSYCDKSFSVRSGRFIHEKRHLKGVAPKSPKCKIDNVPQTCDICNKVCSNKMYLKMHKESHNENRKFKCSICGKDYPSQKLLTRHSVIHGDKKRHPCTYCGKRFTQRESLTVHLRSHTGERPYPCTLCTKRFIQRNHLSYHMQLHKQIKSFACKFCRKLFSQKGNLTVHLRIHTGERPYQCHVCKQGFRDSSSRKRHVVSKHGIDEVKSIQDIDV